MCHMADRVGRRGWTLVVGKLLLRLQAKLWWVLLASLLLLLVPLLHAELSSALKVVLPGLYTILLMLLMLELGWHRWLLELLLWPLLLVLVLHVAVFMGCFAYSVAAGVVVAFLQGLCLWLRCYVHITDLLAWDIGFFLCSVAILFSFCVIWWIKRCGSDWRRQRWCKFVNMRHGWWRRWWWQWWH